MKTPDQETLISKIMKSGKILDKEYRMFRTILDKQVVSSYDASIFIEYILSLLKFRRTFFNGKHKAYKKCRYCDSRDQVERFEHLRTGKKLWVCRSCYINLDGSQFIPVKIDENNKVLSVEDQASYDGWKCSQAEEKEAQADLYKKYDYTPEQEEIDEDARHGDLE